MIPWNGGGADTAPLAGGSRASFSRFGGTAAEAMRVAAMVDLAAAVALAGAAADRCRRRAPTPTPLLLPQEHINDIMAREVERVYCQVLSTME